LEFLQGRRAKTPQTKRSQKEVEWAEGQSTLNEKKSSATKGGASVKQSWGCNGGDDNLTTKRTGMRRSREKPSLRGGENVIRKSRTKEGDISDYWDSE